MSYLKKLKELIGDEAFKKVEADLNGKELILNDGNYIPKKTFDDKLDEIKTLTKEKETLTGDLKTSQDGLKKLEDEKKSGNQTVEQQIADLNKKIDEQNNKIAQKDKELQLKNHESLLKDSLTGAGVKNPKNLKLLMKEFDLDKLEVDKEGKIKGFDDSVKKLQEDYKPLFGEEQFSGNPPGQGNGTTTEDMKEMSTEDFYSSEVFGKK
ncbi:MAG: phage scaffolding protein [Bacteroidetes bacterium]|nr:phage scaffolding protein [Bacteroidota bacterium]